MTQKEATKFLSNTKVYVSGKSKEIQEKLFSLGFHWQYKGKQVSNTEKPFLFMGRDMNIYYCNDMEEFTNNNVFREIMANDILNIVIDEPKYRPFKDANECWKAMWKHQPFGWVFENSFGKMLIIRVIEHGVDIFDGSHISYTDAFSDRNLRFADGTPFGVKEEETTHGA